MEAAEDNLGDSSAQPNSPWALGRLFSNIALILILIMNIFNTGEVGAVKVQCQGEQVHNRVVFMAGHLSLPGQLPLPQRMHFFISGDGECFC